MNLAQAVAVCCYELKVLNCTEEGSVQLVIVRCRKGHRPAVVGEVERLVMSWKS